MINFMTNMFVKGAPAVVLDARDGGDASGGGTIEVEAAEVRGLFAYPNPIPNSNPNPNPNQSPVTLPLPLPLTLTLTLTRCAACSPTPRVARPRCRTARPSRASQ